MIFCRVLSKKLSWNKLGAPYIFRLLKGNLGKEAFGQIGWNSLKLYRDLFLSNNHHWHCK